MATEYVQLPATGTGQADVLVAVETIDGKEYQKMKLIESTAESETPTGTTANPLQVALPAATVTTLTPPAAITGFATETTLGTVHGHVDSIDGKTPALGQALAAASVPVVLTAAQITTLTPVTAVTVTNATATNLKAEAAIAAGQTIAVTSGTAANCKVEAAIAATQTLSTVTTVGTVTTLTNWEGVLVDDAAFTPATSKVRAIGCQADETSPDSVDEGDVGCPRMTLDRMQIVTDRPSATGEGLLIARNIDVDESEEDIKTSAGKIYGWYLFNAHTATLFVKFYNATAANTTVGTTTPAMTLPVPAGAAANVHFNKGITFDTALCIAATTGVADNDTGAPAANVLIANIFYK